MMEVRTMLPIGPLMSEHRVIARMIRVAGKALEKGRDAMNAQGYELDSRLLHQEFEDLIKTQSQSKK